MSDRQALMLIATTLWVLAYPDLKEDRITMNQGIKMALGFVILWGIFL